ncbi:hypothetical protein GCM10020001_000150 [Nonomuraea salmonea]
MNFASFDHPVRFGECTAESHNLSTGPINGTRISVYAGSDDIDIKIDANRDADGVAPAADISRRFRTIVRWLATAEPADTISRAGLLDEEERRQVVEEWSGAEAGSVGGSVVEWFGVRAGEVPGAVAVVWGVSRCRSVRWSRGRIGWRVSWWRRVLGVSRWWVCVCRVGWMLLWRCWRCGRPGVRFFAG